MISNEFNYDEIASKENFGIKNYKDSIYRGELSSNRKRHGKGVITYFNGRIYEGEWQGDKRHGHGYE